MAFDYIFRYAFVCLATEVAGYGCEARLRGLDRAMPDDARKRHTPRAMESEARAGGLDVATGDTTTFMMQRSSEAAALHHLLSRAPRCCGALAAPQKAPAMARW